MYGLVGKRTIGKTDLFECVFLGARLPCKQVTTYIFLNVDRNDLPKELMTVACPHTTLTWDTYQWKITTSKAVAMTASADSKATDLALLPIYKGLEVTFQISHVCEELLSSTRKAPTPYKTAGFNKGDLHCALPIRGLLPEDTLHNDNT